MLSCHVAGLDLSHFKGVCTSELMSHPSMASLHGFPNIVPLASPHHSCVAFGWLRCASQSTTSFDAKYMPHTPNWSGFKLQGWGTMHGVVQVQVHDRVLPNWYSGNW